VRFTLTAGQKGDAPQAAALIEGLPAEVVMADTAYDADHLRQAIAAKGALAVIPNNPSRALKYPLDKHLYAQRHLVECCFSKLKQFRRVATRFEKTAKNYRAIVTLAAIVLHHLEHDPEKWEPVFRKDHAQTRVGAPQNTFEPLPAGHLPDDRNLRLVPRFRLSALFTLSVVNLCRISVTDATRGDLNLQFWGLTAHGLFILQCSNYLYLVAFRLSCQRSCRCPSRTISTSCDA
jgi:transposase